MVACRSYETKLSARLAMRSGVSLKIRLAINRLHRYSVPGNNMVADFRSNDFGHNISLPNSMYNYGDCTLR